MSVHSSLLRDWQGSQCITPFHNRALCRADRAEAVVHEIFKKIEWYLSHILTTVACNKHIEVSKCMFATFYIYIYIYIYCNWWLTNNKYHNPISDGCATIVIIGYK
jgi:hypothetical protein